MQLTADVMAFQEYDKKMKEVLDENNFEVQFTEEPQKKFDAAVAWNKDKWTKVDGGCVFHIETKKGMSLCLFLLDVFKPMLTLLFFCLNVLNASSNDCGHYRTNASACGWDWSRKRRPPKERRRRCVKSVVTSMDCCRLVLLQEPQ